MISLVMVTRNCVILEPHKTIMYIIDCVGFPIDELDVEGPRDLRCFFTGLQ